MQRVAAYLLERTDHTGFPDVRRAEGERILAVVETWLRRKGASSSESGTYTAVDGSDARFRIVRASDGERSWKMYELTEITVEGRKFVTSVSITVGRRGVIVFVTMEVGSVSTQVNRIDVDPRTPRVVRDLLASPGSWHHGQARLRKLSRLNGFDAGDALVDDILTRERLIPYVVVSKVNGTAALKGLDERLADDLAGLANVYAVDEEAAWALTDRLRRPYSCYAGAVRIYWPGFSFQDEPVQHHLWTASRLIGLEGDPRFSLERIRRQVRSVIMRASAASVVRPAEIDDIRGAAARAEYAALQAKANALEELKKEATSLEEFREIADSYAEDNDRLRSELVARDAQIEELTSELQRLELEKQGLAFHLRQAKTAKEEAAEVESDVPEDDGVTPPSPGEIRFYKKKTSAPTHDVMLRVADCGCNTWQGAAKADKAKKGIARLEGNREWKNIQHCGACTGGGMWRVQW